MNILRQYTIQFVGLKDGLHDYSYDIDMKFFEAFEYEDIHGANLTVKVTLNKSAYTMALDYLIKGTVKVQCDRCLDFFDIPINIEQSQIVRSGETDFEDDMDLLTITPESADLNLAQSIFDYVVLHVPYRHVHPEDRNGKSTCNPDMIEQIDEYSIEDEDQISNDPRWDQLKNLLQ